MAEDDKALLDLLGRLAELGYRFITPTPETHRRVVARRAEGRGPRDIFGWSLPFAREALRDDLFALLGEAGMLSEKDGRWRSRVRVSSVGETLFLHSAYPTGSRDAVFLGPDSYRFVRFLSAGLAGAAPARRLVDIGAGAGVGAVAAGLAGAAARLTLTNVNPLALRFARINARAAGLDVETVEGPGLDPVEGGFDIVVMNPPFLLDPAGRAYRDGGGRHGAALSLGWALAAARRVAPGGRVLLYTGSAIVDGEDRLEAELRARLPEGCELDYAELDPDIFGEELDRPGYEEVERIAAVGAVIVKAG